MYKSRNQPPNHYINIQMCHNIVWSQTRLWWITFKTNSQKSAKLHTQHQNNDIIIIRHAVFTTPLNIRVIKAASFKKILLHFSLGLLAWQALTSLRCSPRRSCHGFGVHCFWSRRIPRDGNGFICFNLSRNYLRLIKIFWRLCQRSHFKTFDLVRDNWLGFRLSGSELTYMYLI